MTQRGAFPTDINPMYQTQLSHAPQVHRFVKTPVPHFPVKSPNSPSNIRSPSNTPTNFPPTHILKPARNTQQSFTSDSILPFVPTSNQELQVVQTVPYNLEIIPQEYLFNRLQWYYITLKFTDQKGNPFFVGHPVQFDNDIAFVDGRRRNSSNSEMQDASRTLYLSIVGLCSSTRSNLRKCVRCREKDESRIKRKRKRDTTMSWNQIDEDNNSKFIQVLTSGNEVVDNEGQVKFRLRVACCVGVNKQHHMNHVTNSPKNSDKEIHRGCEGMALHVVTTGGGFNYHSKVVSRPIRVLGKVTEADRQKLYDSSTTVYNGNDEPPSPPGSPKQDLKSEVVALQSSKENVIKNTEIWLLTLAPVPDEAETFFHNLVTQYKKDFDIIFPSPIKDIYDPAFFTASNLMTINPESPQMTEIYSVVAAGSCQKNVGLVEPLMKQTMFILHNLSQKKIHDDNDALLLASSLNRTAMYFGFLGDITNARLYNERAFSILDDLSQATEILSHPVYESTVWVKVTYHLDLATIQNGFEWSKSHGKALMNAYTLFLLIITLSDPEMKTGVPSLKSRDPIKDNQKAMLLGLISLLTNLLVELKHHQVFEGKRSYAKLIDNGIASIKSWLENDINSAIDFIEATAIQAALLKQPRLEAFIPVYFASLSATQMLFIDPKKYADVAELLISTLNKINVFRWARILVDYLIGMLESFTGKLEWSV